MPNPTKISLPRINYRFIASACVPVLTVMLNKVEKDYSAVNKLLMANMEFVYGA